MNLTDKVHESFEIYVVLWFGVTLWWAFRVDSIRSIVWYGESYLWESVSIEHFENARDTNGHLAWSDSRQTLKSTMESFQSKLTSFGKCMAHDMTLHTHLIPWGTNDYSLYTFFIFIHISSISLKRSINHKSVLVQLISWGQFGAKPWFKSIVTNTHMRH